MERGQFYYMQQFRNHLIRFLDELIEQFPNEAHFVIMRIFIKDQIPIADVIGRFIRDILPYRKEAIARDDQFFINHPILQIHIKGKDQEKRDHLTRLWMSDALDETDRKIIWDWVDIFMEFGNKYFTQYGYVPGWEPVDST
jgi:hypothetical protein